VKQLNRNMNFRKVNKMRKFEIYTRNFRVFPRLVFGFAIGFKKHCHFRDKHPYHYRFGSSWKLCLLIACFEIHIMLWQAKEESEGE